jgi:hypothetical protein
MDRHSHSAPLAARVLISVVFILNSVGIIDQTISAKGLMERRDNGESGKNGRL